MSMPKMRSVILWDNFIATIGTSTSAFNISNIEILGIFIEVSAATDIILQYETIRGWKNWETYSFAALGDLPVNLWKIPIQKIRFTTTANATITIQLFLKN